jgi:cytochrome b
VSEAKTPLDTVAVWDVPTRIFHWALLALVLLAWRTAETGDMGLHRLAGSGVAGLLVFRLWWGLFGSSTARFSQFLKGPAVVLAYGRRLFTRDKATTPVGHNPMGGWSVAALLLCLLLLVGFGLFAVDTDGLESGPLSGLVDFDQGRLASRLHDIAFSVLQALVCLHLAAMVFYHLFKRQNLIGAMVTGRIKSQATGMKQGSAIMLLIGIALGTGVALWLARMGGAF